MGNTILKGDDIMPAGRPKKEIDYILAEKLANIMCTQEEIATMFDCDVRTLQRDEEFCRVFKKGKENGKMSLRRNQWKLSEKNTAMAIWLGKQYLGQRDTNNADVSNEEALKRLDVLLEEQKNA
jgi:hypothetical protein